MGPALQAVRYRFHEHLGLCFLFTARQDKTEAAVRKQELCSYSSYSDVQCPHQETTNCCFSLPSSGSYHPSLPTSGPVFHKSLLSYSVEVCQMFDQKWLQKLKENRGQLNDGQELKGKRLLSLPLLACSLSFFMSCSLVCQAQHFQYLILKTLFWKSTVMKKQRSLG